MTERSSGAAVVIEKLREFDRVACLLEIPLAERLGILNVAEHTYERLCTGRIEQNQSLKPELERRLSYALPLMRRLVGNNPLLRNAPTERMHAA